MSKEKNGDVTVKDLFIQVDSLNSKIEKLQAELAALETQKSTVVYNIMVKAGTKGPFTRGGKRLMIVGRAPNIPIENPTAAQKKAYQDSIPDSDRTWFFKGETDKTALSMD